MTTAPRWAIVVGGGGIALLGAMALGLALGPVSIGLRTILRALWMHGGDTESVIVLQLRLPRVVLAALSGGGLAVAGASFQALTRNPLADPAVLGVAGGAAFAVVSAEIAGFSRTPLGYLGLSTFAFAGAVVAAGLVFLIARSDGVIPIQTLVLAGVIVGLFFSASITLLISFVDFTRLGAINYWMMGNLAAVGLRPLGVLAAGLALGEGALLLQARALNLLAVGEESALHGGVSVERLKRVVFLTASLITGLVVAFAGPIGFVGLIVPHTVRLLLGPDHRIVFPASILGGGVFLVLADGLARTVIQPAELPIGVITAICGAPFFIALLRRHPGGSAA